MFYFNKWLLVNSEFTYENMMQMIIMGIICLLGEVRKKELKKTFVFNNLTELINNNSLTSIQIINKLSLGKSFSTFKHHNEYGMNIYGYVYPNKKDIILVYYDMITLNLNFELYDPNDVNLVIERLNELKLISFRTDLLFDENKIHSFFTNSYITYTINSIQEMNKKVKKYNILRKPTL